MSRRPLGLDLPFPVPGSSGAYPSHGVIWRVTVLALALTIVELVAARGAVIVLRADSAHAAVLADVGRFAWSGSTVTIKGLSARCSYRRSRCRMRVVTS